ncbi:hypothetical protein K432DRAFT_83313 [Lepidopterella palustris CBS 459.81]|uniref:Uncharacterized protein n=1 Tax=Lepidopterella palustris CBS 459.81 TaxID=1314670 RepID=A0A8E2E7L7_9PEZI|nr:hypothetical protein K432DRAFT_83313 [Lepidopterella palustris CBS 459.81]
MPMWPFGRRGRRATKLKVEGPEDAAEGKKPAASYASPPSSNMPDTSQGVGRRLSRRHSRRKRRASSRSSASMHDGEKNSSDFEPTRELSEKKQSFPQSSAEDITALPFTKELGTSPHLRPITQDHHIPYNFQLSHSHTSIPSAKERGKLQRPQTLRSKRSANEPALPRKKSSKKRKNDHVREEEIRAMSMPLPQKRPAGNFGGLLRRDSKKMRSGLNRHLERPTSNISLPLEESIHSSMSGNSDTRAFRVSALDMFSPRPIIRYSLSSPYQAAGTNLAQQNPSRANSRREKRPTISKDDKEPLKKSKTIDDLADTLDAGALREIMERDKRRREKKRKADDERMRRRLERRAEKQRAKEQRDQQVPGAPAVFPQQVKGSIGLGIEKELTTVEEYTPALSTTEQKGTQNNETYIDYPPRGQIPSSPSADKELKTTSLHHDLPTPTPLESPFEEPVISTAQAVRYSQASMSPPTPSMPHHARDSSNISQMPDLISEIPELPVLESVEPAEVAQLPPNARRSSEVSGAGTFQPLPSTRRSSEASGGRRMGAWASFFRRGGAGKRASLDQGRSTPSEVSFSNTSRESMSRQPPPAHLVGPIQVRRTSGTPARTTSKFREDLPEFPLSPPDSRVQSPEAPGTKSSPIATRRGYKPPSNIQVDPNAPPPRSSFDDPHSKARTDSPVSPGARASGLMSQSLASVDSEGSWLSGKPIKRKSNQVHVRNSGGSSSTPKQLEDFSTSYEELGIPDDEYFWRLTPQPDERRRSAQSGDVFARKPSSTAMAATAESDTEDELRSSPTEKPTLEENVVHSVGRQPTVVHRQPRVKSREGLLSYFLEDDSSQGGSSPSNIDERPKTEPESPTDDLQDTEPAFVQRAKSVDLGKGHVRHLSAGSAKLLDIPAKRGSTSSTSHSRSPNVE